MRFIDIKGQVCRFLPYDRDLFKRGPQGDDKAFCNLFVKGLPNSWTHRDLYNAFKVFGEILSSRVSINENYESRGFGFI